jgi:hypothetical protein
VTPTPDEATVREILRLADNCRAAKLRLDNAHIEDRDYQWSEVRKCFHGCERALLDKCPWDFIEAICRDWNGKGAKSDCSIA